MAVEVAWFCPLAGDPDQVLGKLRACGGFGIESFILSGYPHAAECDLVGRYLLPESRQTPGRIG
jgi:alkanesulfonate monooxygenase